ncbi:hypothetical protein [Streptomyces sp. NPDC002671]
MERITAESSRLGEMVDDLASVVLSWARVFEQGLEKVNVNGGSPGPITATC